MKKRVIFFILLTICFPMLAQVQIIAHRGASYLAPENTVASAKLAWDLGTDAVEVDIFLSKDNRIIGIHDPTARRTSGHDYVVMDTHSDVLRTLEVGSFKDEKYRGEKIPFLEEIIQTIPHGKELVVELKCGSEVLPYLKEVIEKYGENRIFSFIAFDLQTIIDTKKVFPDKACYWLCNNYEFLKKNINTVAGAGLEGVSLRYSIIDDNVMAMADRLGLDVFTYTVNNPDEAKRLIDLGVKGITTDRPGWLREQLSGVN